ncbi:MAG: short-chain dehydrogenase [Elusimicrobia bacterium]|nr:MAG: short-chain dehydrogenase [Elusimicrobiota bacterium]
MSAVLITGVHTGIGLALAESFLDSDWTVHGLSRRAPASLAGRDGFDFKTLDLSDFDSIAPAISDLGDLDLVVLNAGVLGRLADWGDQSTAEIRRVMDINVWANRVLLDGLFAGTRKVKQVVGISSGAAVNCSGGWGPYSVSKAALNALLQVYSEEKPETHFTALAPGVIRTAMTEGIFSIAGDEKHGATTRVQATAGTATLQTPESAAKRLRSAFPVLLNEPSGSFLDVRSMQL